VRANLDPLGIGQELVDELLDLLGQRRGEEHPLRVRRGALEQPSDLRQESQVEHAIGLVDHHLLDEGEGHGVGLEQLAEPPRRADEDVDALGERLLLRRDRALAGDDEGSQDESLHEPREFLLDLRGEFAGRADHECAKPRAWIHAALAACGRRIPQQPLREGKPEGDRLAGAGGCEGDDVAAREARRQRQGLDRPRLREAHRLERAKEAVVVGEFVEAHGAWIRGGEFSPLTRSGKRRAAASMPPGAGVIGPPRTP
jgi:hypothetical protein